MSKNALAGIVWVGVGFLAGVATCVVGYVGYQALERRQAPQPSPPPSLATPAPPETIPTPAVEVAAPPPEPSPEPVASAPAPRPSARPAQPPPTTLARAPQPDLGQTLAMADKAAAEGRWDAAQAGYEQSLRIAPGNPRGQAGLARAVGASYALRRTFVAEVGSADRGAAGRLSGFEADDVDVKKAARVGARVEFTAVPARVKPGDAYSITIALFNEGKKNIKLRALRLTENVNGAPRPVEQGLRANEVRKGERATLAVVGGAWPAATREWSLDVQVTSNQGDVYAARVVWR